RESQPQCIGPAAGTVLLIAGGAERRTHGPALELAAGPVAVAQLDRADKSFLLAIIEHGRQLDRLITRPIAKVLRHGRRLDHLAGVEEVVRIEGCLDLTERLVDRRPEHLPVPLAAGQAVAMFAAQRAA